MDATSLHAEYENELRQISRPSFSEIRSVAQRLLNRHFKDEMDSLNDSLDRGKAILEREEQSWRYLYAFGRKHPRHLRIAFEKLPNPAKVLKDGYAVVDWGCGTALATICLMDYLKEKGFEALPRQVVLVEPSLPSIENARLHLDLYGVSDVRLVQKRLDDVVDDDIETDAPVTIHLFSNILDVDGFDLKRLAHLVSDNAWGDTYLVCVSPRYPGDRRLFRFVRDYFNGTDIYDSNSLVLPSEDVKVSYAVLKYTPGKSSVIQVEYYPPVRFFAAYQLDSVADGLRRNEDRDSGESQEVPSWSAFDVAAPFELGGHVYDDVDPMLAVLNNIVTRGLPTKCSPFVEEAFEPYGETKEPDELGTIKFSCKPSDSNLVRFARAWTPVGIARVQKTILEAIICRKLGMESQLWRVLVRERDVPCAALAFEDLRQMMVHLSSLTDVDFGMPEVDLTIVCNEAYEDSPLHLGARVVTEVDESLKSKRFDMVIDVSTKGGITEDRLGFSEFRANSGCYFVIGSGNEARHGSTRQIYTSGTITYLPLGQTSRSGEFNKDSERVGHLTYFLNLLFRKREFRDGQIPILNRALQNKNVIGLLPTGGGKSLTYQLAAMLQPGVTIVIDPLRSLMLDQYQGLREAGIDACAYINSTLSTGQRRQAERRMESSQLQFVFLSPERLCIYEFRRRLETMHEMGVYFAYGVIDEVHCVSEWGHDFRFSYLHLGRNLYQYVHAKDRARSLTLFGLTATASFDVLSDVERELSGAGAYPLDANTVVRYENTDRLELQYRVDRVPVEFGEAKGPSLGAGLPKPRYISKWDANDRKSEYLAKHILGIPGEIAELQTEESLERIRHRFAERQNVPADVDGVRLQCDLPANMFERSEEYSQAGIVFCPHRDNTGVSVARNRDALSAIVPDIGTFVGSSEDDRDQDEESFKNLELFKRNRQPLMIATKAFGMGIDKPNVRFTVNLNYPSSLESFVQEAGRAGRDRRISLATILVGDYRLARVSPGCPIGTWPVQRIKGCWYEAEDLAKVLEYYRIALPGEYLETATPGDDWVEPECIDGTAGDSRDLRRWKKRMFRGGTCTSQCVNYEECTLRLLSPEFRGWRRYAEVEAEFDRLRIPKTNLVYMNADYGNNMFFYNNNFLGERAEKKALHEAFCRTEIQVSLDGMSERGALFPVPSLIDAVLSLDVDQELVAFVRYSERMGGKGAGYGSIQKAIYRMCCIGFIDDFTQDYRRKEFRLVMRRKAPGEYYEGLKQFLMRYYAEERAAELVAEVPNRRGENEVQRCLGFLIEFIYSKIAVKRKRALDDVRAFCAEGMYANVDWKEANEGLKDHIYYYFNSKYAQDDYVADTGEGFSLTSDTDRGRKGYDNGSWPIVLKYLRVVDDDLVGAGGTPIDNVKHLQGAVRLIRRSVTDDVNPCLCLLNHFCLTQLGTNESEVLERELADDYRAGMAGFAERSESLGEFWRFKEEFDGRIVSAQPRYSKTRMRLLQDEVRAQVHLTALRRIRSQYAAGKTTGDTNEQA